MSTKNVTAYQDSIETFLSEWVRKNKVPGLSVAVVSGDEATYTDAFGARNLSTNESATPQTLFGIGSCSKSVTAVAILQLVEEDELDLTSPINSFVPHLEAAPGSSVTVEELLSHSSGLPSDGSLTALIARLTGLREMGVPLSDDRDFHRHVQGSVEERRDPQAKEFFYCNTGFTLLGKVIESVTGKSYSTYVRENIFEPLEMDRSCFSRAAFESYDDRMQAYFQNDDDLVEARLPVDPLLYAPGGVISCADDLVNYLRFYLNGGSFEGKQLLSQESMAQMFEPRSTRSTFIDGTERQYGLGWELQSFLGNRLVRHGGMMGTTTAAVAFFPDQNVGVSIACNVSPPQHPSVACHGVLSLLEGNDPKRSVPALLLEEKLGSLEGEYKSYRGIVEATVERDGGTLEVTIQGFTSEFSISLFPNDLSGDIYEFETVTDTGQRLAVKFEEGSDGSIDLFLRRWRLHAQ
ncbi:penicillin-binding protein, beta-lactamase class C [Halogeometricum borinquense DSM 11551]|uniref:Penicillin-binding protein, beta-lactamase class C n=1 Tax=Halogeometricum borinquense (strain ATCC 700274 / DSM 11551 / JCM 10706 / KCTC 4070 / PR3) TaxID=469382 RepID=E4NW82_HALBP|nr:serine hydrolase [Halogeometricum borinquense]ADQ69302.1 penicillin-binding protein, beta-lactamase class C [Halogeometricum borinquense DSM 11551]ELY31785.1 penicillin-binding protein, beta-lactamase class C [Halogeometricum borinquense DSM 11551]